MARAYIQYEDTGNGNTKTMFQDEIGMMEIQTLNESSHILLLYRKSTDDVEEEGDYATLALAQARMKAIADM